MLNSPNLAISNLMNGINELNYFPISQGMSIKTVLGLDATGSMHIALKKVCEIIGDAFDRAYSVIKSKKVEAFI